MMQVFMRLMFITPIPGSWGILLSGKKGIMEKRKERKGRKKGRKKRKKKRKRGWEGGSKERRKEGLYQ